MRVSPYPLLGNAQNMQDVWRHVLCGVFGKMKVTVRAPYITRVSFINIRRQGFFLSKVGDKLYLQLYYSYL